MLGELTIPDFRETAAAEWGDVYAGFLQKLGVGIWRPPSYCLAAK